MGTKFGNIHVKGGNGEELRQRCPDYTVTPISNGWVTLTSENFEWGTTHLAAKNLSKKIPQPMLSVEYFDNDYVDFLIYQGGKRIARHIPQGYEGSERKPGKPNAFVQAFDLSSEDEKALKLIFKETSIQTSVSLMESLLGCPIWGNNGRHNEVTDIIPDRAYFEEYIKKSKIKNQAKATLVNQKTGIVGNAGRYSVFQEERDGKTVQAVYHVESDGTLEYRFHLPEGWYWDPLLPIAEGFGMIAFVIDNVDPSKPFYCHYSDYNIHLDLLITDPKGEILWRKKWDFKHPGNLLDGVPFLFLNDHQFLWVAECYDIEKTNPVWNLNLSKHTSLRSSFLLPSGRILIQYEIWNKTGKFQQIFEVRDLQGNVKNQLYFSSFYPGIVIGKSGIYIDFIRKGKEDESDDYEGCLAYYDYDLQEQYQILYQSPAGMSGMVVNREESKGTVSQSGGSYLQFNLETKEMIRKFKGQNHAWDYDVLGEIPHFGYVLKKGESTLSIYTELGELISKHRLKGEIHDYWQDDEGNFFFVTWKNDRPDTHPGVTRPPDEEIVYIYKVHPLKKQNNS